MTSPSKPVFIIGAGLSGLALAQGLHQAGIPILVYERHDAQQDLNSGYRIRMDGEAIEGLKGILPAATFDRVMSSTAIELPFGGAFGAVEGEEREFGGIRVPGRPSHENNSNLRAMPGNAPPIERSLLHLALSTGIEEYITYGKTLDLYASNEQGVKACFTDGSRSEIGSLLVGADGVNSKVVEQLVGSRTWQRDLDFRVIWGRTVITPEVERAVDPLLLHRFRIVIDDSRKPDDYAFMVTEAMRYDPPDDKPTPNIPWLIAGWGPRFHEKLPPSELSTKLTAHWKGSFAALLQHQDPAVSIMRDIQTTDPETGPPQWHANPRVTVVGDAIHPMSVTGGKGASIALKDAVTLASILTKTMSASGWRMEDVASYETTMREYATAAIRGSLERGIKAFGIKPLQPRG